MRFNLPLCLLLPLAACDAEPSPLAPARQAPWLATAVGRLDAKDEARQLVAETDGVIRHVYVRRGERVTVGEKLLDVACDPRVAAASTRSADALGASASAELVREGPRHEAIAAAAADVAGARAAVDNQQQRYTLARGLIDRGFIAQRELDSRAHDLEIARAAAASAQARLATLQNGARDGERVQANASARAAKAQLTEARALASQCTLRSPIDGEVLQIFRREGEFSGASQGTPLVVVGDVSTLIVRAEINEHDAAQIVPGQSAEIWVEGQRKHWNAHVTRLASIMGRRSARSLDPSDRFDRDVREAFLSFDSAQPPALVGLRVTVGIKR